MFEFSRRLYERDDGESRGDDSVNTAAGTRFGPSESISSCLFWQETNIDAANAVPGTCSPLLYFSVVLELALTGMLTGPNSCSYFNEQTLLGTTCCAVRATRQRLDN